MVFGRDAASPAGGEVIPHQLFHGGGSGLRLDGQVGHLKKASSVVQEDGPGESYPAELPTPDLTGPEEGEARGRAPIELGGGAWSRRRDSNPLPQPWEG
jgi:hypothetical protein